MEVAGIDRYLRHAKKFGTEGVMEAARDEGCTLDELVMLQTNVDAIEAAATHPSRRHKRRKTAEQRVRDWLGLADETEEGAA